MLILLFVVAATSPLTGECAYVATLPCGGTVPIDSQFIFDPIWSLSPYRDRIRRASGVDMTVTKGPLPRAIHNVVKSETGMDPNAVTVFRLAPRLRDEESTTSGSESEGSSSLSSATGSDECTVFLDPLRAALAGIRSTAARLVFLEITDSNTGYGSCAASVAMSVALGSTTSSLTLSRASLNSPLVQGISLGGGGSSSNNAVDWPATITFPSACQIQLLFLTDRHGRIDTWYTWIPTTVYTAVVTALILPTLLVRKEMPTGLIALDIQLVFLGYFGACVGLIVELICWQSSLGRMFPFPSAVTLYTCLSVLYALYFLPLVYRRRGHYRILLLGVLRLLVYGLNCALCVGYWISGYVLLGSLALFQYVVTNAVVTFYFARLTVQLRNVTLERGPVRFAHAFTYLWFVPATPFAVCALMYSELYMLTNVGAAKSPDGARVRDVVRVYNAQMTIPLLVFQNVFGVCLVAVATAFHMPFSIALFIAVWAFSLHFILSCDAYVRECRRWGERGIVSLSSFTLCDWIWLTPMMDVLLQRSNANTHIERKGGNVDLDELAPHGGGEIRRNTNNAASPSWSADGFSASALETSDRHRQPSLFNQPYQQQMRRSVGYGDALDQGSNVRSGSDRGPVYFPPMPQPNVDQARASQQRAGDDSPSGGGSGYDEAATPTNQRAGNSADLQFWPTSVEK